MENNKALNCAWWSYRWIKVRFAYSQLLSMESLRLIDYIQVINVKDQGTNNKKTMEIA